MKGGEAIVYRDSNLNFDSKCPNFLQLIPTPLQLLSWGTPCSTVCSVVSVTSFFLLSMAAILVSEKGQVIFRHYNKRSISSDKVWLSDEQKCGTRGLMSGLLPSTGHSKGRGSDGMTMNLRAMGQICDVIWCSKLKCS